MTETSSAHTDWITARAEAAHPRLGARLTLPADGRVILQLSLRPFPECAGCGQQLPEDRPLPATWLDDRTGDPIGSWDHQHGCGTSNSPVEVIAELTDDDGDVPADPADVDDAISQIKALAKVTVDDEVAVITDRLRDALAAAVADPDDETLLTGRDDQPGVWRNYDGRLEAWDYCPGWPDEELGTSTIVVTEHD